MTDRGAGDTLLIHHRQACYASALAPDTRIVEDGRLHRLVDCLSTGFIRRQDGAMLAYLAHKMANLAPFWEPSWFI